MNYYPPRVRIVATIGALIVIALLPIYGLWIFAARWRIGASAGHAPSGKGNVMTRSTMTATDGEAG